MQGYKYKFGNSEVKTIQREEGDTYIMSDGTNVQKKIFETLFEPCNGPVNETRHHGNSHNIMNSGLPIMQNTGMNYHDDDDVMDPDVFFNAQTNLYQQQIALQNDPQYQAQVKQQMYQADLQRQRNPDGSVYDRGGANPQQDLGPVADPNAYVSPYGTQVAPKVIKKTNPAALDPMFADAIVEGVSNNANQHVQHQHIPQQQHYQHQVPVAQQPNYVQQAAPVNHPLYNKIKRKHTHNFVFKFEKMIADPDFIKIMDSNMEDSLIELFANEFTNEVLRDPSSLKQMFIDELDMLVYGKKKPKPKAKIGKKKGVNDTVDSSNIHGNVMNELFKEDGSQAGENHKPEVLYDEASGKKIAPVDPRFAHLPPVLEDDEEIDFVIIEEPLEEIPPQQIENPLIH